MAYALNKRLSTIATAWMNTNYIANLVMPPVQVPGAAFERREFTRDWKIPDAKVGRTGNPTRVGQEATLVSEAVNNYALSWEVALSDIDDQRRQDGANQVDIVGTEVEATADYLMLAREKRVSAMVTNSSNYASGSSSTLSGASQWSHTSSNPVVAIKNALRSTPIRPNVMVIGHAAFDTLSMHAKMAKLIHANDGDVAIVSPEQIARAFMLVTVLVGMTWFDSANPGQDENLSKLWGKHCALLRVENMPGTPRNPKPVWGMTGMLGSRMAYQWTDPEGGVAGVLRGKVAERCSEIVVAKEAGYLFKNVIL